MKLDRTNHEPRIWALHQYLKDNQHRYVKRIEILLALKDEYFNRSIDDFQLNMIDIYNTPEASQLNKDIKTIKLSTIIQRVLIGNSQRGIKYATKEEYLQYRAREKKAIIRKCQTLATQDKKYDLNGQYKLVFHTEKECVESLTEVE
jgi:hypothetical protein